MPESVEDFEGWDDLEDEEDGPSEEDLRVEAINEEIARFEQQAGVELSDADWQHIGTQIDLFGITPEEAFSRTDQGRDDERFADLAQRIATGEGRELTRGELERLAALDEQAELTGEGEIDVSSALYDLDSSEGREAFIDERMTVPQEREEPSANVIDPETDESKPGFNLDKSDERAAAIDALMGGDDVAAYDSSYEPIEVEGDE